MQPIKEREGSTSGCVCSCSMHDSRSDPRDARDLLFPPSSFKMKRKGKGGRPTMGDAVGEWFTRLRELTHVTGRKPLHSFRHTVVTRLLSAGVPQDIREILVGHASTSVHGSVYTHREEVPLNLLQRHLEKLQFHEVAGELPTNCTFSGNGCR